MKKIYEAPTFELELYELNTSIASHCSTVVSSGPVAPGHELCSDFPDPFSAIKLPDASVMSGPYNVVFYEDTNCDCYTTGGDSGYWTS